MSYDLDLMSIAKTLEGIRDALAVIAATLSLGPRDQDEWVDIGASEWQHGIVRIHRVTGQIEKLDETNGVFTWIPVPMGTP